MITKLCPFIYSFFLIDDYKDKTIDNFGELNFFPVESRPQSYKKKNPLKNLLNGMSKISEG